jgi:hypothetical protein
MFDTETISDIHTINGLYGMNVANFVEVSTQVYSVSTLLLSSEYVKGNVNIEVFPASHVSRVINCWRTEWTSHTARIRINCLHTSQKT